MIAFKTTSQIEISQILV
uniref:Uncharacterized protein n=1 Tax=Moniliophthora roreri TaxID=221103 RepID=A0A0W0FAV0_MONRR